MSFPQGINFRQSSGYVTDPTDTTYEIGTTANYPRTTPQGNNVGYTDVSAGVNTRNRSTGVDARLAGTHFHTSTTVPNKYRIDLPATGNYKIRVAMGDQAAGTVQKRLDLYDNTSSLGTVCAAGAFISGGTFQDALDANYSAANWPTSNSLSGTFTFSSTAAIFYLGPRDAISGNEHWAHLWIESAGGGGGFSPWWASAVRVRTIGAGVH